MIGPEGSAPVTGCIPGREWVALLPAVDENGDGG